MAKKTVKKEAENTIPLAFAEGQGMIETHKMTAKEYIENEYPEISRSPDSIPALLMAILTEVVKGRVER